MLELKQFKSPSTSAIALIIANFAPLFGVLFLGWDLFLILFLYWTESAVIGFFNVVKMLTLANTLKLNQENHEGAALQNARKIPFFILKIFLVGFFIFHY